MSLLQMSKNRKAGSTWGRICDSFFRPARRRHSERKNRRLRIDPLEERTLLSVSPADVVANLVNSVSSTGAASTVGAQSVAVDENGDFVVAWTRTDLVYDSLGDRVIDPETEVFMVETNVYARYFTNEVQQIELPEDVLLDADTGSYATADISYGGNEVQLLTFTSATWTEIQEDFGMVSRIAGSFKLWLDVNVDGVQDVGEVTDTIDFNEAFFNSTNPAQEPQATLIQDALQALGGDLADVVVTSIDSQNYTISFGDASGGVDQDLLVVVDQAFGGGNLASASVSPVLEPFTITFVISPDDPSLTAHSIEDAFQVLYDNYFQATTNTAVPDNNGVNVVRVAIPTVSVTSLKTADDPDGLRTFNIEFTGDSALTDVPTMVISSVEDEAGNVLVSAATAFQATTIKEPSPEFRVNPEEPDNPFTALPDKYDQYNACVAMDADGDFIITWEGEIPDAHNSGSVTDIFARLFQPVGIVDPGDPEHGLGIWEVDLDNDGVAETQIQGVRPVEVAVPYSTLLSDTSPFKVADDLYTFRANEYTTNAQSNPSVAMDSKGNFAISWSSGGQDISYFNSIYVRSFSSDGSPINAVEVMVNEEVTDWNDDSFVALSDGGYYVVVWVQSNTAYSRLDAKLYDPDCTVALDQFVVVAAGSGQIIGPSATFDTADNFFIGWTHVDADQDNNGLTSTGYYAVEYDVAGVQIRDTLRANSASLDVDTLTSWPLDQYNGQVVMDADGDLTIIYEGFGPDVSENSGLGAPMSRAVLLIQDLFLLEENADLVAVLPVVLSPAFTLPLPMALGGGNTSGDTDGVIEEMLLMAFNNGATQSQIGRMYAIFNGAVGLLRGEADGIMYSQFDTDPNLAQSNILNSDTIVNSLRDGNNTRFAVSLSLMAADGDFTFQITNDVTGQTMTVTLEPVYINDVLIPPLTTIAFEEQMEDALSAWGINWNRTDFEGLIDVRYMTAAEATARNASYWPLLDFYGGRVHSINPATQHIWEFTFQGEIHDTSISMVYDSNSLANADGDLLDDLGIPPPEFVGMPVYTTSGLQTGTVQHNASVAMTADGDFVVVYTEDEKNAFGAVTNQNIYYRFYDESTETAGPTVASVETTDGQSLDGTQVYQSDGVTYIVLSMSEKMYDNATSTGDAVTNTDNYVLYDASGNVIEGAVTATHYGLDEAVNLNRMAADDPATYGSFSVLSSLPSNKYEIVLVIDANGTAAGVTSLGTGTYTLELLSPVDSTPSTIGYSGLRDAAGTPLNRTGYVPDGENTSITFSLVVGNDDADLTGTEILVNDTTTGVQTTSSTYNLPAGTQYNNRTVAVDNDGDYVVVWISYGQDGDSDDTSDNYDENYATSAGVYMQLFDSEGHALAPETLVNTYTIGNQTDCTVAIDADGEFVVVWVGEGQDADGSSGIYGQRFDSMGWKLGGEFQVNTITIGDQVTPSVAIDSFGNFVVTWATQGQAGGFFNEVKAQTFNAEGVKTASEILVSSAGVSDADEAHPVVAVGDVGTFIVVWSYVTDRVNGVVTDTALAARLFAMDGIPLTDPFQVNVGNGGANNPLARSARNAQVAMERDGDFIVVWEAYTADPGDYDVHFRMYGNNGAPRTGEMRANVTVPDDMVTYSYYADDQINPSVAIDVDGDFVIVWNGNGAETNPLTPLDFGSIANADTQGVWGRKFNPFGEAVSTEFRVNLTQIGYQGLASVDMTTAGDYVVAWSGNGCGDTRGVYAKIVDEPSDTAGPMVTDFLLPDGTPVAVSGQIMQPIYAIAVTFDEELLDNVAHTGDAATNPANYALLIDGMEVAGGINQVFFGLDKAHELSPQYGLSAQQTNKWQAVLIVDANGASEGVEALTDGRYQIVIKGNLRDKFGNPLLSTGENLDGFTVSGVIYVTVPTGQETLVSDGTDQISPEGQHTYATTADSVASDADGDYVVAWTDETPGHEGVWVKMYEQTSTLETDGARTTTVEELVVINPATGLAWAENEILISADPTASDISVARDADGDFVVTWSAWNSETNWDVFAQRFNAAGQAEGDIFRVNSFTDNVQRYSAAAMDVDGDFVVTWQSLDQDGSGYGIYAQRYSNTGEIVNGADEMQQITFTGGFTGTFKIRWDDDDNPATADKVTTVISFSGNAFAIAEDVENALKAIGAEVEVEASSVTSLTVRFIGSNGGRDVRPLWISIADVVRTGGDASAEVTTRTAGDGQSGEFIVNDTTDGNQMFPDIAMDADGDFAITWTSSGQDGDAATESNVYAKQFVGNYAYWTSSSASSATNNGASATSGRSQPQLTTVDDPDNHLVPGGTQFDGVVQVLVTIGNIGELGSGSLLAGTNYILTAAHVVWWDQFGGPAPSGSVSVFFDTAAGRVEMAVGDVIVHPGYTGDANDGNDLALLRLEGTLPEGVMGYDINRTTDEIGELGIFCGYGMTGTGATGATDDVDDLKRAGMNRIESTGDLLGYDADTLAADFDNGTTQNDAFGQLYDINNLGEGDNEVMIASGDSGSPVFIDGVIAGVVSMVVSFVGSWDVVPGTNSSFGDFSLSVRVSAYAGWISSVTQISGAEFLVNANDALDVDGDGNTIFADNQSGVQSHSSVAMDADGDFVVVWTSYGQDGVGEGYGPGFNGINGVFARRYFSDGTETSNVFQVNQVAEDNQQNARVAMDVDGDFVVAWESFQDGNPASNYGIYAQRYASTGLVQYTTGVYANAPLALAGSNPLLGFNGEIGGEFAVNTTKNGDQRYPGVAMDDTGDVVVVWSGNGEVPGQEDSQGIFFQRFAQSEDDAGPTVGDVLNVGSRNGTVTLDRVLDDTDVDSEVVRFVVTFGEDVSTASGGNGADSVLNPANWQVTKDGRVLAGAVATVQYGLNMAYDLGLVSEPSNKYEAVITFDGDSAAAGNQALGQGTYVLTLRDAVMDLFGNRLDGDYNGAAGANFNRTFTVLGGTAGDGEDDDGATPPGDPPPDSTDPIVNTNTTGRQDSPAVATDADGNHVVAWVSYAAGAAGDVMAQLFDKTGQTIGREFTVNSFATGSQIDPDVAMDSYGNFVVVWSGQGGDDQSGVFARVYDKYGRTVATDFRVNQFTQNVQDMPAVAMDADGDFVVTWTSYGQDGDMDGIYARRFNLQGLALDNEFLVNTTWQYRQEDSDVAMDDAGNFVVAWRSDQQDGNSWGIYGQRFAATGATLGGEFRANTYALDDQIDPAVAMDADGDFIVAWSSMGQDGSGYGIYARRYNPAGTAKDASEFRVNQTTLNWQVTPDVGMTANGDFVVTWSSFQDVPDPNSLTMDYGIYARMFNANGSDYTTTTGQTLGEFRVNAILDGNQVTPAIGVSSAGRFAVAWAGPDGNDMGIFARVIDPAAQSSTSTAQGPTIGGVVVSQAQGVMTWNAADDDGVASSYITIDGVNYNGNPSPASPSSVNFWTLIGNLSSGPHDYTITAVDKAGNSSQLTGSFTLTGGSTTGAGPGIGGVVVSQAQGVMTWNATDGDGVGDASIVIDGVNYNGNPFPESPSSVNFWTSIGNLSADTYDYTITAVDKAGNSSQLSGSFTLTGGSTTGTGPVIGSVLVSEAQGVMTWNATDADGVASAYITIDGVNYGGNPSPESPSSVNFWTLIGNLSAGPHDYTITAVDQAGNSSQYIGSFTLTGGSTTGTGPVISSVVVSQDHGVMTWNATDADGVASSTIVINGVNYNGNPFPMDSSSVNFWMSITNLSAGTYDYTITAVDNAENSSQLSSSFTLTGSSSLVSRNALLGLPVLALHKRRKKSSPLAARNALFGGVGRSEPESSVELDWLYDSEEMEALSDAEEHTSSSLVDAVMATY